MDSTAAGDRIVAERIAAPRAAPSKLNTAVLKNVGRIVLIHTLALKSRVNPELMRIVCGRQECTPLRSRQARSNDTYSLERR